jgi:murein DD-endopeptidase MepM/ murein hydrolase activator NlpD
MHPLMVHRLNVLRTSPARRAIALVAVTVTMVTLGPGHAHASQVRSALARMRRIDHQLQVVRRHHAQTGAHVGNLREKLHRELARLGSPGDLGLARWKMARAHLQGALRHLRGDAHRVNRSTHRRLTRLMQRRVTTASWLATWGVFLRCPIAGPNAVTDNFGITVRLPNVPVHRHMGNDILAATGTPIVAPFDGYASASSSDLGGLEVRVTGSRGYVYNAHLASYGSLGSVRTGEVIGYVGSTGDATAPHDHFEWHPGGGAAVDPNPLLSVSC